MSRFSVCISVVLLLLIVPQRMYAAATYSATIRLKRGVPTVRAYVNGHGPYTFIVDTGTTAEVILTPQLVSKLKLRKVGTKQIFDAQQNGMRIADLVAIDWIELAGDRLRAVTALVSPLPQSGRSYDGVLGFDLFRDTLLTLNLRAHKLELSEGQLSPDSDTNLLAFQRRDGVPAVTVTIDGHQAEAGIDTGATGVILPETMAKNLRFTQPLVLLSKAETLVSQFDVMGGTLTGDLRLAGFDFARPFVGVSSGVPIVCLGADTFTDFKITFDARRNLMRFASPKRVHRLRRAPDQDLLSAPPFGVVDAVVRTERPD